MAQGVGSATQVRNSRDTLGKTLLGCVDYKGSASYVQGGDAIDVKPFGIYNALLSLIGSIDQTDKWMAVGLPVNSNVTAWRLVWISLTTATVGGQAQTAGQEAAAGTNLSTFIVRLAALGY